MVSPGLHWASPSRTVMAAHVMCTKRHRLNNTRPPDVYLYSPHPAFNTLGNGSSSSSAAAGMVREGGRREAAWLQSVSFSSPLSLLPPIELRTNVARCFALPEDRERGGGETVHGLVISFESIQNILCLIQFL